MAYKSANLEKLRILSENLVKETEAKAEIIMDLNDVCSMIDKNKMNKQAIKDKISSIIDKIKTPQ